MVRPDPRWEELQKNILTTTSYVTNTAIHFIDSVQQQQSTLQQQCGILGIITFGSTLAICTYLQFKVLKVSTGTKAPIPSILGIVSVSCASLTSYYLCKSPTTVVRFLGTTTSPEDHHRNNNNNPTLNNTIQYYTQQFDSLLLRIGSSSSTSNGGWGRNKNSQDRDSIELLPNLQIPLEPLRICLIGLLIFKVFGGRFWCLAPSSYTNVGSFGRKLGSIPAKERYATPKERSRLQTMGTLYGCHTCGSRRLFTKNRFLGFGRNRPFVGDHMPPKSVRQQQQTKYIPSLFLLRNKNPYRYYPQCIPCSNKQGSILSAAVVANNTSIHSTTTPRFFVPKPQNLATAGGGTLAYFHGCTFRLYHLTGWILGGLAATAFSSQAEPPPKG